MYIDISSDDRKREVYDLFKSFSSKKEIYEYYGVCSNTANIKYINKVAEEIGFDFNWYKEKKKRYCLECGKELCNGQKKFCSSSCAASFNNRNRVLSTETKEKISLKLRTNVITNRERKGSGYKRNYYTFKERLFRDGIKERKCEKCGITEWMGEKIVLQVHHIDGNNQNNAIENIQILCPNCHSQTDNFCGKNVATNKEITCCKGCGKPLAHRTVHGYCLACYRERLNVLKHKPEKETLANDFLEIKTFAGLARKYSVNPTTIKRWLMDYGII